jgi:hypothetical protein
MNLFTDAELQTLSAEIDQQLNELKTDSASEEGNTRHTGHTPKTVPSKQKQQLEQATGESADSFMKKFTHAAKKDLCEEGGLLHDQFEEMGNMSKKSMLVIFGGILSGIGLPAAAIQTTVVAVSVIVLHIGIKAFCADCENDD